MDLASEEPIASRQSTRIKIKKNLSNRTKSFIFIDQPTFEMNPDGTEKKAVWNGIERKWEGDLKRWGVQTTKNLPAKFCFPYGSAPNALSEQEVINLAKKGGDATTYIAEYDTVFDKSYRSRLQAQKKKISEKIMIDAHPDRLTKLKYPADVWIGSYVNSLANQNDPTTKFNCCLEIVGEEYKDQRQYPYCKYFLFVVLLEDVPAGTWLSLPYGWGKNYTTRHLGPAPIETSGKRKTAKNDSQSSSSSAATSSKTKQTKGRPTKHRLVKSPRREVAVQQEVRLYPSYPSV